MKEYNKLVRDNIIDIIEKQSKATYIVLDEKQYKYHLKRKLIEESKELDSSIDINELMLEMADVFEVLESLIKVYNIDINDVLRLKENKARERGKFEKRLFLQSVEENYE
jgi:predicted house-cleaning noncanonical NTP pyrophosphatase (MazG superfamily)